MKKVLITLSLVRAFVKCNEKRLMLLTLTKSAVHCIIMLSTRENVMAENNFNNQEVTTEDQISAVEDVENEVVEESVEVAEAPKKRKFEFKFKNPQTQEKWEKVLAWLDAHETIMQAIKFTLISLVAFLSEFAIMYILQYSLYNVCGKEDFSFWIFTYGGGKAHGFGLAGFIAMLGSKLVAEIISFTQNWKKNFKANSNRAFAVTVYVITVVAIIIFTQWLSGALASVIESEAGLTICKMLGSIVSFVVIFLMDKFVIMRRKPEKKEETTACNCDGTCDCCSCGVNAEAQADEESKEVASDVEEPAEIPED